MLLWLCVVHCSVLHFCWFPWQHLLLSCFFTVEFASLSATGSQSDQDGKKRAIYTWMSQSTIFLCPSQSLIWVFLLLQPISILICTIIWITSFWTEIPPFGVVLEKFAARLHLLRPKMWNNSYTFNWECINEFLRQKAESHHHHHQGTYRYKVATFNRP